MNLPFRYALKDLRGAARSLRIVLMCLILGTATIAAVQFTSRSVLDGIQTNGRTILGADMIVRNLYAPASPDLRSWFEDRGAAMIETIEARVMLANAATQDNTLVELKAVPQGYPLYGDFAVQGGGELQQKLQDKGILLDPALETRLNVKAGDRVQLGQQAFTVQGFIEKEPDRAGGSRFGLAPRAVIAASDLESTGLLQTGSMVYYDLRLALPDGVDLSVIKTDLEAVYPDAGWKVTDADNASPQIRRFVERLMLFLTLVGLSALLIGGIGIGNGMRAHFETRLKTIAIFKSLGAARPLIAKIYLWQALLVTLIGTGVGMLIGALLPFFAAPYLSAYLPFVVEPRLTPEGFVFPVLAGFLISFCFTLIPLGQAIATSPLDLFRTAFAPMSARTPRAYWMASLVLAAALALLAVLSAQDLSFARWFVAGAVFSLIMFRGLGWALSRAAGSVQAPKNPALRLGLRNLHRPGNATANTLVSLGLGLTVMVSVTLIELNLRDGVVRNLPADAPAFFFLDIQGDQKDDFVQLLSQQPSANTIRLSPNLRGRIVAVNGVPAEEALMDNSERWLLQNDRGFTYVSELPAHSEVLEGEWWAADYQGPPLVSVVEDVQRGFGVKVGDEITVNILGRDITAKIANVRSVDWMNFTINFAITFAPGTLEAAPHSWLATVVADPQQETQIQRAIGSAFPNISMIRLSEAVEAASGIMRNIATAVRATALVAIVTGILVLAGSLAATRTQRLYDTVVLKVIGIRRGILVQGLLFEFALLGFLAGVLSLGLGAVISWAVMVPMMDLSWRFYLIPSLATLAAGIGLTMLMGWAVTGRVLSATVAPYLREDG